MELAPTNSNLDEISASVLCLMNAERTKRGQRPLEANGQLARAAQRMSEAMVSEHFMSHEMPDGKGLEDRVQPTGYIPNHDRWLLGENLAWGRGPQSTPASIVDGWMHSERHRENLLEADFDEVGLGITLGSPLNDEGGATLVADYGTKDSRPALGAPSRLRVDPDGAEVRGLSVTVTCSRPCTLRAQLVSARTARRSRVLASDGLRLPAGGSGTVTVDVPHGALTDKVSVVTKLVGWSIVKTTRVTFAADAEPEETVADLPAPGPPADRGRGYGTCGPTEPVSKRSKMSSCSIRNESSNPKPELPVK